MRKADQFFAIVLRIGQWLLSNFRKFASRGMPISSKSRYRLSYEASSASRIDLLQPRNLIRADFKDLVELGYDVQRIPDGAKPIVPDRLSEIPDKWKHPQKVVVPEVAILRHAILFSQGWAILPPTPGHHGVFIDEGTTKYPDRTLNLDQESFLARINDPILRHNRLMPVSGRCFSLRSKLVKNFGKFINYILTKIYYEELGVIAPGREKIIPPLFKLPMQQILFEKIFSGYEIVPAEWRVALEVEELVMSSNLRVGESFNPEAVGNLSKRLRHIMACYAGTEKFKVCISRRDGNNERRGRYFINYDLFEELAVDMGYQVVEVSKLEPNEQFRLWANTTHLLGVHGAGMMNMIMMPSGGKYIEIANPTYNRDCTQKPEDHARFVCASSAMAAGHKVFGIPSMLDQKGYPVINLKHVERVLHENL